MNESNAIIGAWQLEHFEEAGQGNVYQYSDILIFSKSYYSDFQVDRANPGSLHCHVGLYKIRKDNGITFHIQQSNRPENIGRVELGTFTLEGDHLRISFTRGGQPGVWVYHRLD